MIVLKYVKSDEARFISHIDLLRHMSRILRRADIPVKFSQGFNPHALVFFSPPLTLGASSLAEYVTIDVDMDKDEVFERFNKAAPHGVRAVDRFDVPRNPNLQALSAASDFVYPYPYRQLDLSSVVVRYQKNGKEIEENISDKIYCAFETDGKLTLRIATGGVNLRPDRVLEYLCAAYGESYKVTDVTKTKLYLMDKGELIDADAYLADLTRR